MFFTDLIKRRLVSLLQPWLQQELELELELGFLRSRAIARDLSFDTSALNQLLDDSSGFSFKEVRVQQLILRVSNWSAPAFNFELHGLHITLSVGEVEERGLTPRQKPIDTSSGDMKKVLSEIDPEGTALHDTVKRISETTCSRSWTSSLLNSILTYCRLQVHDIHLLVQSPISNDSFSFSWEINELNADSRFLEHGCFPLGFISSFFVPSRESCFYIDIRGFEVGLKKNGRTSHIVPSTDLLTSIKLKDLQLISLNFCVPQLDLLFSPADVSVILAINALSSKERKSPRNGRQLWAIAARRISSLMPTRRWSFYKVVYVVCRWLVYVHAYENLLLAVGYPMDSRIKGSAVKMLQDNFFSKSVKNQWEVISEMEKELSAEAVALARRVSRCRAVNVYQAKDGSNGPLLVNIQFKIFQKILQVLAFICNTVCCVFMSIMHFLFLRSTVADYPKSTELGVVYEDFCPQQCLSVNMGKIVITISPENAVHPPAGGKAILDTGISYSDLLSFCLSIDSFFFLYKENVCEQCLSFSCGRLKVISSSVMADSSNNYNSYRKGHRKPKVHESKTILWAEPAQIFNSAETIGSRAANDIERTTLPFLDNLLREMWLNWKRSSSGSEETKIWYLENPSILCEINNFLTDPALRSLSAGLWSCSLVVGKMNFVLEFSSILSIAILMRQIEHALSCNDGSRKAKVTSLTPATSADPPAIDWHSKYNSYVIGIEMALHKILPDKLIQVGLFVAGPHVRVSLKNGELQGKSAYFNSRHEDFLLAFDFRNIELAISPTLESEIASSRDAESEGTRLKDLEIIDIPETNNEVFRYQGKTSLSAWLKVHGLSAYLEDSLRNQRHQIVELNLTTVQLSSRREEFRSFGTASISFSAALHGLSAGVTVLLFMDELFALVEVVVGFFLSSAVSHAFTVFGSFGGVKCQELIKLEMGHADTENKGKLINGAPSLVFTSSVFVINCNTELKSLDIILHKSRKSNNMEDYMIDVDAMRSTRKLSLHDLPDYGVSISVHKSSVEISFGEGKLEALTNVSGIRAIIFKYASEIERSSDQFGLMPLHSPLFLHEVSISDCMFALQSRSFHNNVFSGVGESAIEASTSGSKISQIVEDSSLTLDAEASRGQSSSSSPKLGFLQNMMSPTSSNWILVNIALSEIYLGGCPVKDILVGAHQSKKLESTVFIGKEGRTISCQMQGGSIFLETTAVVMFFQSFASYRGCINNLLSAAQSSKKHKVSARGEDISILDDRLAQETQNRQSGLREKLEALTIDVSQFSLALVASDGSGRLQELLFGADVHLQYEVDDPREKFSFGLSNLSILSHVLHENVEQKTSEIQISRISSPMPTDTSSHLTPENSVSQILNISPGNYILKQLGASIAVEKYWQMDRVATLHPNQCWIGGGSISGLDMTISLLEIQMILVAVESLSGVFGKETTSNVERTNWSSNQEPERSFEEIAPDGAIVALQDVHQHMYITVEEAENKYTLAGAIHYSLVGEKALFRVKYHYQSGWKSPVLWISLTSLHAKIDSGEPLRLNCRSGSGFVDISSSSDSKWALWKVLPYKIESYKDDAELESYSPVAKNTFYLVNRKNDRGIAFIDDGSLEFVSKPGNPFKWKVFLEESLPRDFVLLNNHSEEASRTTIPRTSHSNEEGTAGTGGLSCIDIAIAKVNVTIVHELSDTKEKVPLLQGSATFTEFIVQILYNKARVMSKVEVVLLYFNAQRNLWEELVHPLEICIFYRSTFQIQGSETVLPGAPLHFYARIKEVDISVTELSVDILLFVIGKLNLAGPYAVRSSVISANCCKVENQTGLTLHCHFYDNKDVSIARNKSATFLLRHLALLNQSAEASFLSIQLADKGAFSTSPIHLSLLEATEFAWRTRIVSLQDSKTYPGPTLVVEISQNTEDGLSIVVSPLLRIHNETDFSMELRFQRPQQMEPEFASVLLKAADSIDDAMATFGAISLSGGVKKALMSLSVGNFLVSFRPEMADDLTNLEKKLLSVEWSDDLKGGKAVRLSGLFDKLSYQVRKAFSVESVKCSFTTSHCSLRFEDGHVADIHFLVQSIVRSVPIIPPDKSENPSETRNSPVAVQEQKEISLLPTVRVYNLLQSEISVLLTDKDPSATVSWDKIGKQATIPCAASVNLYANPATIYFIVTLTELSLSCKPVDSSHWVKKLQKQKSDVHGLDIELNFGSGKSFAFLRLSRGHRGILEAAIFTSYTLKNDTEFRLCCFAPNQKPLSRDEAEKLGSTIPPELGFLLPPKSTRSWFLKSNKVCLKLLEEKASEALLDLDALSGPTEIDLEVEGSGLKYITKLGVSLSPSVNDALVPAQTVSMNPRYIVFNESENAVIVRQCYLEDDTEGMIAINGQEKTALKLRSVTIEKRETSIFENFLRKHKNSRDDSSPFIQFRPNEAGLGWSGPVCVASLGRFFLKFRRSVNFPLQESDLTAKDEKIQFASVHVVEEGSSLVLHFHRPPKIKLPYRIENCLRNASISYYQKGSLEPEVLGSGSSVNYVWDDLTLPYKLVVKISDVSLLREINLNKVRAWKPIYRVRQSRGLGFHLPLEGKPGDHKGTNFGQLNSMEMMVNFGYEVYADGPTRVLRICELSDSHKGDIVVQSNAKIRLRVSYSSVQLLEHAKQVIDRSEPSVYTPIIVMKLGNINLDSMLTDQYKFNQLSVQSLSVDEKWVGAPFAAMVRKHRSEYTDSNESILNVVLVVLSSNSSVKQIKYSSIVLQPLDLNLDEETLMRIVPFWRTSLSDPNTPSQQYYFDHFEIHPIKIIASFLPGDSFYSYSSTQETLRSLLHSVIKIPAIKNKTVELNGVLVTHALITIRELSLKCAQHYSWYAMRAIYIAKGSPLLPPAFASVFDDLASSSLDAFFDPSSGLITIPGLTIGTFKLLSKCIDGRGFSGTKRYFGDMGKSLKTAGSSILFAAVTEISDSVLKGAETSGFNGMITGFHQGILKLAMEPSVLGTALMEGGSDRKIKLDRNPGVDELYIEGYLQAMLDTIYKQEYLRVRVVENQVILKNLPPNSSLIEEIIDRVKGFLVSKTLLKGDSSRHIRPPQGESEWKIGPTILTLCEHLFVSFVIRMLRKQASKAMGRVKWKGKLLTIDDDHNKAIVSAPTNEEQQEKVKFVWKWGIGKFVLSGIVAYIDGRLCRSIPNPIARRIVSGFLLSFLDKDDGE